MIWLYSGFLALVLILLALDLGVFHRKAHVVSMREALGWSAFWIFLGLLFSGFIFLGYENHWLGLGLTPDMMGSVGTNVAGVGTVYNEGVFRHDEISYGISGRKVPVRGQHLRHQHDFRVPGGSPDLSTPGAVLGNTRGAPHARGDDCGRRRNDAAFFVDHLRLRRIPHHHRHKDAAAENSAHRS